MYPLSVKFNRTGREISFLHDADESDNKIVRRGRISRHFGIYICVTRVYGDNSDAHDRSIDIMIKIKLGYMEAREREM